MHEIKLAQNSWVEFVPVVPAENPSPPAPAENQAPQNPNKESPALESQPEKSEVQESVPPVEIVSSENNVRRLRKRLSLQTMKKLPQ